MTLRITKVVTDVDMRGVHKLRKQWHGLKTAKEACLLLNRSRTIARVIDYAKGVHTFYAEKGRVFDEKAIAEAIRAFGGLRVTVAKNQAEKVVPPVELEEAA